MKRNQTDLAKLFLNEVQRNLLRHDFPRIDRCLKQLSDKQIWWRPNRASNSIGNLVLHLSGNVRQWIVSGLGGAPDTRHRAEEFAARGPMPRSALAKQLRKTITEACRVLQKLTPRDLERSYSIQGFQITGIEAADHVANHFAYHTGQIIFVTKLKLEKDLGFTRLPGTKPKPQRARTIRTV